MSLDFKALNEQLKINIVTLLHEWLPGGNVIGSEYCCGDRTGKRGKSFKVNLETTLWSDFATGDKGGDLISLYSNIKSIGTGEAYQKLASMPGIALSDISPNNPKFPKLADETELPPEVHEPPLFRLGDIKATNYWTYKNPIGRVMFYVARFDLKDENNIRYKEFRPFSWRGGVWTNKMWPAPRPLYGLDLLAKEPTKPVMIVEGEKACDAAREFAGNTYVVVTWPGGANAIDKIDWAPLKDRNILIWPDNDEPGREAGKKLVQKLIRLASLVKILNVHEDNLPEKWDAADSGFNYNQFKDWAKPIAIICEKPTDPEPLPETKDVSPEEKSKAKAEKKDRATFPVWIEIGFTLGGSGAPITNMSNCHHFLHFYNGKEFTIWYDEFYQSVMVQWPGEEPRAWTDNDDSRVLIIAQREAKFSTAKFDQLVRAVQLFAREHTRNEPKDWITSLKWDGVNRLPIFFSDYMGSEENVYTSKVSLNFWISMIARVMKPGCKVDNMVILEGHQGARKSTALSIIGGKWFTECDEKMGTKDFYQKIQGHLLVEIAELDSFQRSEVTTIKNVLTQRVDKFRPPYGRNTAAFPRQCVFVGTTNSDDYLKDPTGARRFWPIAINKINNEDLLKDRDQLFAEAYHLYMEGTEWWEVPKEQAEFEQAGRSDTDAWSNIINDYLLKVDRTTVVEIMMNGLKFDASRIDRGSQMRIAAILKRAGWKKSKRRWVGSKTGPNEWERIIPLYEHREEDTNLMPTYNNDESESGFLI